MRYIQRISLLFIVFSALLTGCSAQYEKSTSSPLPFRRIKEGWTAGFADLPADHDSAQFMLDSGWGSLPSGIRRECPIPERKQS